MILGMHDARRVAESILSLARGDCEICGQPIGGAYCAPAQILTRKTKEGPTIELRYEVACEECFGHLKQCLEARRSLRSDDDAESL